MIDDKTILVAFDTETTGLSASQGKIVEIAALKFDFSGRVIDKYSELVNPGEKIPADAMNVHHITDEMVADMPLIAEVLPRFIEFFAGEDNVLIAQNALFDIGFVNHEAINNEIKLPRNIILDQIELTRKAFPDLPTYSLERTCRRFNLVDSQSHRAMSDSVLVMKLFLHCLNQFKDDAERFGMLNSFYHYSFGGPMVIKTDEAMMETINGALERGAILEIIYAGGSLKGKPRQIAPALLYNRDGVAYLTAKCLNSNSNKQFRLDRIRECRIVNAGDK
jgi:DNA polymerase III epsilon subunit family exonuclease